MRRIGLLVAMVAAIMAAATAAHADVISVAAGKCLDDTNWSRTPGQALQVWSCTGGTNQDWDRTFAGWYWLTEPTYIYRNHYSGLCLDVYGSNHTAGTRAVQWYCNTNDQAERMWYPTSSSPPVLQNVGTGNCLDDWWGRTGNGNPVDFYSCNGTNAQKWWRNGTS